MKLPSLWGLKLEVHRDCKSTLKWKRKAAFMTALCKTVFKMVAYMIGTTFDKV